MRERDFQAFQAIVVEARRYWMSEIWSGLKADYAALAAGQPIRTEQDVAALLEPHPTYWFYAWLERHIQREKYSGRYGLTRKLRDVTPPLPANAPLTLDPSVPVPDYYAAVDTHQHPGNLFDGPGAALVYKASAGSTQPGATSRGYALHERFAAWLDRFGPFERVVDLGCGFGKSSITIAQRFPRAEVTGIELTRPCLELAASEAVEAGVGNVAYRQADVCATRLPGASFDLVTSTMLLHELDTPAVRDVLRESYRLLEPGGKVVHLDFQIGDPFLAFIHHGHGRRNNEPYMEPLNRMDLTAEFRAAGFDAVEIAPFEEADGAARADWPTWRFPWTTFVATKPERA